MLKYCIETVQKPTVDFLIVHQHDCPRFPSMEILSLSRFKDIGPCASNDDALQKAREINLDSYPCYFCWGEAPVRKRQS